MLRRAALPFRSTEGFHPQPRLVFALSLPLGVAGLNEVVEIEWTEPVEPESALERLRQQAPPGITFLTAKRIDLKRTARVTRAYYRLFVPETDMDGLRNRCATKMAAAEIWVDRERPTPRQVNIRPYVNSLECGSNSLRMECWVTPEGSARADELVRSLELNSLLDAGLFLERTNLEILDEIDPADTTARPILPSREDRDSFVRLLAKPATAPEERPAVHAANWGASPNGPIVE
jgi:radical SAM-linked protein